MKIDSKTTVYKIINVFFVRQAAGKPVTVTGDIVGLKKVCIVY